MNTSQPKDPSLFIVRVVLFFLLCVAAAAAPFVEKLGQSRIVPSGFSIKP